MNRINPSRPWAVVFSNMDEKLAAHEWINKHLRYFFVSEDIAKERLSDTVAYNGGFFTNGILDGKVLNHLILGSGVCPFDRPHIILPFVATKRIIVDGEIVIRENLDTTTEVKNLERELTELDNRRCKINWRLNELRFPKESI